MLLGAYLGGHLVFGEQIGVNHAAQPELPSDFAPVMRDSDLPENEPRRAQYNGLPVVLVRRNSRVYALYERCAHMSGPLADGTLEGNGIRCPWHGSCFSLEDGHVIEGPATNPQPSFETRISDGQIFLRSREPESP
jgi:nitrite reductase/ring-hydroxylating ferredoxin subunit